MENIHIFAIILQYYCHYVNELKPALIWEFNQWSDCDDCYRGDLRIFISRFKPIYKQ